MLGITLGFALWWELLDRLESLRPASRIAFAKRWCRSLRLPISSVIYSILCLVGGYYAYAGMSKLLPGENLLDWVRFNHLENLFVASHLNG